MTQPGKGKYRSTVEVQVERVRARLLGESWPPPPEKKNAEPSEPERRISTCRYNVVCWDCRVVERQPGGRHNCRECGKTLSHVGQRLRLPARNRRKAWKALQLRYEKKEV